MIDLQVNFWSTSSGRRLLVNVLRCWILREEAPRRSAVIFRVDKSVLELAHLSPSGHYQVKLGCPL